METIWRILQESWQFLLMSSPYILMGLFVSGLIRSFLNPQTIVKYLGRNSFRSVINAALLGVPLPLCSCGVVPTAIALRRQGASRGAVLTFLITTPESGIDAIAMTYALIDPVMALARPIVAFASGIVAGIMDLLWGGVDAAPTEDVRCPKCVDQPMAETLPRRLADRLQEGFRFSFVTLLNDISGWFLLGVLIAGIVATLVPADFIDHYLGGGLSAMLIAMLAAAPVYVCASGSTPVVAALILKGMSPGAALVFLITGPATNAATLLMVQRFLGWRTTIIYLTAIAGVAIGAGYILDAVYRTFHITLAVSAHNMAHDMGGWWLLPSTIVLLGMMGTAKWQSQKL